LIKKWLYGFCAAIYRSLSNNYGKIEFNPTRNYEKVNDFGENVAVYTLRATSNRLLGCWVYFETSEMPHGYGLASRSFR